MSTRQSFPLSKAVGLLTIHLHLVLSLVLAQSLERRTQLFMPVKNDVLENAGGDKRSETSLYVCPFHTVCVPPLYVIVIPCHRPHVL